MIIINVLGILLIGLIVWWFWLYKAKEVADSSPRLTVVIENGIYTPARIRLPANQSATVQFLRLDASPCAEMVIFPDYSVSEELPFNNKKKIHLPGMPKGEYAFHCQMKMYRGTLIIE